MVSGMGKMRITFGGEQGSYNKWFSVFMVLYPILCIYKGVSSITVGDVLLILFFLAGFLNQKPIRIGSREALIFLFVVYAFTMMFVNGLFLQLRNKQDVTAMLIRLIKFSVYMLCAVTIGSRCINVDVFKKTLYTVTIAVCSFLVLQYIFYYTSGTVIRGFIPGVALHLDEYASMNYEALFQKNYRPSSFFLEPSMFCQYVIVALVFALFDTQLSNKSRILLVVSFAVGMLMSTAAQGIAYLTVAFFVFALKSIKNKGYALIFLVVLVCVALFCYNKIEVVKTTADRLLFNKSAANARFGSYEYCFNMGVLHGMIGYGYGATAYDQYMAGATYIWYGCGIVGLLIVFLIFYALHKNAISIRHRVLCVLFFVMFFGTSLFYNYMVYWYFSLIMMKTVEGNCNIIKD